MRKDQKQKAVALLVLVALAAACASVAPGNDPILVRSQQTYVVAVDSFDLLFNLENDNRAALEAAIPGTHKAIDQIKVQAKKALPALRAAIDTYKVNKDKDALLKALAIVESLLRSAQEFIPKLSAAAGKGE